MLRHTWNPESNWAGAQLFSHNRAKRPIFTEYEFRSWGQAGFEPATRMFRLSLLLQCQEAFPLSYCPMVAVQAEPRMTPYMMDHRFLIVAAILV